jgi:hypothetical protein
MYDAATLVTDELERLAPAGATTVPAWSDVVERARRGRAKPRRRAPIVAVALGVIAVAVPAVAFSGLLDLVRPTPVFSSAKPLVSGLVGNSFYAHLWRSPSTTGGTCVFATYDHKPVEARPPKNWNGGGSCSQKGSFRVSPATAAHPLLVTFSIERRLGVAPRKWVPPVVAGSVFPGLHAKRVAVTWRGGSRDLTLRNSWFVGGSRGFFIPPLRKFPFVVVAYDRSGHELARQKLDSPSLLMLRHGWKEFARKYNAWRLHHHP